MVECLYLVCWHSNGLKGLRVLSVKASHSGTRCGLKIKRDSDYDGTTRRGPVRFLGAQYKIVRSLRIV